MITLERIAVRITGAFIANLSLEHARLPLLARRGVCGEAAYGVVGRVRKSWLIEPPPLPNVLGGKLVHFLSTGLCPAPFGSAQHFAYRPTSELPRASVPKLHNVPSGDGFVGGCMNGTLEFP